MRHTVAVRRRLKAILRRLLRVLLSAPSVLRLLTRPRGEGLPFVAPHKVVQKTPVGLHQLDPLRLALQQPPVPPGLHHGQLVLGLFDLPVDQQVKAVFQTDLQTQTHTHTPNFTFKFILPASCGTCCSRVH